MKLFGRKGSTLLFVIMAMTVISVLGTGIYFMTPSAAFSVIDFNEQFRTYQLTLAARDSALSLTLLPGTYTTSDGRKFQIAINGDNITTTVIFQGGTPQETSKTVSFTKTGFSTQPGITLAESIAAMSVTQPTGAPSDFISKTDTTVSLGKIGTPYQSQFGAVVYSGNAVQGSCISGKCEFGTGFNAFFVFQFASGSTGDGFTFMFFNGSNNTATSVGGYAGQGELMGYAGSSYLGSGYYLDNQGGKGIQPPKVALEFDPYQNGTADVCGSDSRYDAAKNHTALMFWGDTTTSCSSLSGTAAGRLSFDDNRHGAGTDGSTDPMNAKSPLQSGWSECSYFNGNNQCGTSDVLGWPTNWLLNAPDNVYAMRMEVTRNLTPVGGPYAYRIKTWIKQCGSGDLSCSVYNDSSNLANLKVSYTDSIPTLDRTIQLDEAHHQAFNTLLFGWTTATGSATQNININRFKMNFLK